MNFKSTFFRSVIGAFVCVSILACSKVADVAAKSCDSAAKKVEDAGNAFFSDVSNKSKCQAYADAIVDMFKECPAYYPAATKQLLQDFQKNGCK